MPRTKQSTIAFAVLIVLSGLFLIGSRAELEPINVITAKSPKLYSVPEIKEIGTASSTYAVNAYVIGKYDCLACPEGRDCRLCPVRESAIIIDSVGRSSPETPMLSSQMIIYSDQGKYLRLGQRYQFNIYLEPDTSATSSILRARVVGYELIGQ